MCPNYHSAIHHPPLPILVLTLGFRLQGQPTLLAYSWCGCLHKTSYTTLFRPQTNPAQPPHHSCLCVCFKGHPAAIKVCYGAVCMLRPVCTIKRWINVLAVPSKYFNIFSQISFNMMRCPSLIWGLFPYMIFVNLGTLPPCKSTVM